MKKIKSTQAKNASLPILLASMPVAPNPVVAPRPLPSPTATLAEVAARIAKGGTEEELLQAIIESAVKLVGADHAAILVYEAEPKRLRMAANTNPLVPPGHEFEIGKGMFSQVIKTQQPMVTAHYETYRNRLKDYEDTAPACVAEVPVVYQGELVGVFGIEVDAARQAPFTAAQLELVSLLASSAASVIYIERIKKRAEAQSAKIARMEQLSDAVHAMDKVIVNTLELPRIAQALITHLWALLPCEHVEIWLAEENLNYVLLAQNAPVPTNRRDNQNERQVKFGNAPLLRELMIHRRSIRIGDVAKHLMWQAQTWGIAQGSWLGVPVLRGKTVLGFLSLTSSTPDAFTNEHARIADTFALQFASAVKASRLFETERARRERLHELTQKVLEAPEEERKRISLELHDEAGQYLTALTINLEILQQDLAGQSQSVVDRARESVAMTRKTMEQIGRLARQLRPPSLDTLGLVGALEELCKDAARRNRIQVHFRSDPVGKLDDKVSLTLYRFVQEALTNVARHAEAQHVGVRLELCAKELRLSVHDDGKGFDTHKRPTVLTRSGHLGLFGMRERLSLLNGYLEIQSQPGHGTVIVARVPLSAEV